MPVTAKHTQYKRRTLTEEETGPQRGLRDVLEVTRLGSCRTWAGFKRTSFARPLALLSRPQHPLPTLRFHPEPFLCQP